MNSKAEDKRNLAYAHCNMRLRTRYDFEISKEQWTKLSNAFTNSAKDQRKNHIGDIEGWIQIKNPNTQENIWICCYYSCQHNYIKTFYAKPPLQGYDETIAKVKEEAQNIIDNAHAKSEIILSDAYMRAAQIKAKAGIEGQAKTNDILGFHRWSRKQFRLITRYYEANADIANEMLKIFSQMPENIQSVQEGEQYLELKAKMINS